MDLPEALRDCLESALSGHSAQALEAAASVLSGRYRTETRDGRLHVSDDLMAAAYLAARLPATYGAVRATFSHVAELREDFAPKSQLDVGSGPGTAFYAAADCWPELAQATLLETSPAMRKAGAQLSASVETCQVDWLAADATSFPKDLGRADLVTLAYVLNELSPDARRVLVGRLWDVSGDMLVLIEPGTPAGWQRLMEAREQLIGLGGFVLAPCPHQQACPLIAPDWCHFSQRVQRSRLHKAVKGAVVPYEDEKYAFLAVSRTASAPPSARVLARAQHGSGKSALKLCGSDGHVEERLITKREGEVYKRARKCDWGDIF